MTDQDAEHKRVHEQFNANDSDVTIESADGVLFQLHTQNLRITTGAFPGSEFSTKGEPTKLTENSDVLEIVFAFTYPQRVPSIDTEDMEFSLLARVAEAVEKYEVFHAMQLCALRMREFLPQYAADVLAHGAKHGYPKLMNEAALCLCRLPVMSQFTHKLSPPTVLAWIKYSESWKAVFQFAIETIQSFTRSGDMHCSRDWQTGSSTVCDTCQVALLKWVMGIEKIVSLSELRASLGPLSHHKIIGLVYCDKGLNCNNSKKCVHRMDQLVKIIEDGIAKIPPFETYLAEFL